MEWFGLLVAVGLLGGTLAGLVGLGGGIILTPLLLYVPPLVGLDGLAMKAVARLTIIQSLCSLSAAGLAHRRARLVHGRLVLWMGPTIAAASLTGAYVSEWQGVSSEHLLALFAALALVAAGLLCRPLGSRLGQETVAAVELVPFSRLRAVAVAAGVGFLGGMVGQGGAFLTIPLLVQVVRIPLRLAIGSSLGISLCSALAGSVGKLAGGGRIPPVQVAALVTGALVGSQLGAALSRRTPVPYLRYVLAALIGAAAIRMWFQVLS